jgi:hypothetical protein
VDDKLYAHVDMIYKYVLTISPGTGGLIDIAKDDSASSLPVKKNGKLELTQAQRKDGEYGAYFTTTKNTSGVTDLLNAITSFLPEELKKVFENSIDAVERGWASTFALCSSTCPSSSPHTVTSLA